MKYLKKTIYYFLFLLVLLSFVWPFNASGKQPTIPVSAAKLTRDMDIDDIIFSISFFFNNKKIFSYLFIFKRFLRNL